MEQNKEIITLREDVNNLKEIVERLTILMNRKLVYELYEEAKDINSGDYLSEEEFEKEHNIKIY